MGISEIKLAEAFKVSPTLLPEIDLKNTSKITGRWKMLFLSMVQVCENSLSLQQHWPSPLGTHTWLFGCQI